MFSVSALLLSHDLVCFDLLCGSVCLFACTVGVSRQAATASLDQRWFGLERLWIRTSLPVQRKCWTAVTSASWYVCVCVYLY